MPSSTYSRRALLKLALSASLVPALRPIAALAADTPPPFEIVFPQDPRVTEFVDSFGFARSGGRRHQGNDLMAPKMTPVYATANGRVIEVKDGGIAGRRVIIDHGNGYESWYLHLNNDTPGTDDGRADWSDTVMPNVAEREIVMAGEHIAWVGDSGNAEWVGSHTHFELHWQGRAIDPYPYLKPAYDAALARTARVFDVTKMA